MLDGWRLGLLMLPASLRNFEILLGRKGFINRRIWWGVIGEYVAYFQLALDVLIDFYV